MNIYLVGYRCTGKTTVARKLGDILKWHVIDSDYEFVKIYKQSIAVLVEKEGWESFRKKETQIIKKISSLERYIVSTGGGIILDKENVFNLRKSGIVVWLKADKKSIFNRIQKDIKSEEQRPQLISANLETEIEQTLHDRIPLYESAMDFFIDTDDETIDNICELIIKNLNKRELNI